MNIKKKKKLLKIYFIEKTVLQTYINFHCFITCYLHEKKMKRGRPVSTGGSHNKKAKTYATTNEDRNPLSRKQSASSGSEKKKNYRLYESVFKETKFK